MTDRAVPRATPTPPTGAAVARQAGVSRATVAYVLNGHPGARVHPLDLARTEESAAGR
ncbi:LacI family DNA-binding transcriptional regulator [Streptomyces platensis]